MSKPNEKKRGASPFTLRERSIVETRWCRDGKTATEIASEIGRHKSSITRELNGRPRHGRGKYDAERANAVALLRIGKRGNIPKTSRIPALRTSIEDKLINGRWSPEQVSIRLPHEYKHDPRMRIATETIYQEVYRRVHRGGNGALKKGTTDLRPYLGTKTQKKSQKGLQEGPESGARRFTSLH